MQRHLELEDVSEADYIFISHAHFDQYADQFETYFFLLMTDAVFLEPIDLRDGLEQ